MGAEFGFVLRTGEVPVQEVVGRAEPELGDRDDTGADLGVRALAHERRRAGGTATVQACGVARRRRDRGSAQRNSSSDVPADAWRNDTCLTASTTSTSSSGPSQPTWVSTVSSRSVRSALPTGPEAAPSSPPSVHQRASTGNRPGRENRARAPSCGWGRSRMPSAAGLGAGTTVVRASTSPGSGRPSRHVNTCTRCTQHPRSRAIVPSRSAQSPVGRIAVLGHETLGLALLLEHGLQQAQRRRRVGRARTVLALLGVDGQVVQLPLVFGRGAEERVGRVAVGLPPVVEPLVVVVELPELRRAIDARRRGRDHALDLRRLADRCERLPREEVRRAQPDA